jgi:hypothetical protein
MFGIRSTESTIGAERGVLYGLDPSPLGWALWTASVAGGSAQAVDHLRSRSAADSAVRELAAGRAHIERHRPVGCRVQPGAV